VTFENLDLWLRLSQHTCKLFQYQQPSWTYACKENCRKKRRGNQDCTNKQATLDTKYRTKTKRTRNTEVIPGANKVLATIISHKTSTVLKKLVLVVNPFTSCWQKISKYYAFILCTKPGKREVVYFSICFCNCSDSVVFFYLFL
jgi:hypothetical protein